MFPSKYGNTSSFLKTLSLWSLSGTDSLAVLGTSPQMSYTCRRTSSR